MAWTGRQVDKEIGYQGLVHEIMEAEKPHDLPPVSKKPMKMSGTVVIQMGKPKNQGSQCCQSQSEFKVLRTRSTDVHIRAGEAGCPSPSREQIGPFATLSLCYSEISGSDDAHLYW